MCNHRYSPSPHLFILQNWNCVNLIITSRSPLSPTPEPLFYFLCLWIWVLYSYFREKNLFGKKKSSSAIQTCLHIQYYPAGVGKETFADIPQWFSTTQNEVFLKKKYKETDSLNYYSPTANLKARKNRIKNIWLNEKLIVLYLQLKLQILVLTKCTFII